MENTTLKARIDALNLDQIKQKLISEKGWADELADHVEKLYKGFLFLNGTMPSQKLVPSQLLDEMWHAHILDTQKYAHDCDVIFGYFLHHYPYFGLRGKEDEAELENAFDVTQKIFLDSLGLVLAVNPAEYQNAANNSATCYGKCGNEVQTTGTTCYGSCGNEIHRRSTTCYGSCGNEIATM